jgi:hypothetical protein
MVTMHPGLFGLIGGAVLLAALLLLFPAPGPEAGLPPVLSVQKGELLYTYHVLTRTEALFDTGEDPRRLRNLCRRHPEDVVELRLDLCRRYGVSDLARLGTSKTDSLRRQLASLGYLR